MEPRKTPSWIIPRGRFTFTSKLKMEEFGMNYIMEVMPSLISGMGVTLSVFFWTLVGSLPLGLIVALGMMSRFKILQKILGIYVWLMRGTPLLLQLIFVFYGLPLLGTGIVLPS